MSNSKQEVDLEDHLEDLVEEHRGWIQMSSGNSSEDSKVEIHSDSKEDQVEIHLKTFSLSSKTSSVEAEGEVGDSNRKPRRVTTSFLDWRLTSWKQ